MFGTFTPICGEMIPNLTAAHMISDGWLNDQKMIGGLSLDYARLCQSLGSQKKFGRSTLPKTNMEPENTPWKRRNI